MVQRFNFNQVYVITLLMHDQITYLASKGHKHATIVLHDIIEIIIFIEIITCVVAKLCRFTQDKLFQQGPNLCEHVFVLLVGFIRPTREFTIIGERLLLPILGTQQ